MILIPRFGLKHSVNLQPLTSFNTDVVANVSLSSEIHTAAKTTDQIENIHRRNEGTGTVDVNLPNVGLTEVKYS
jgi:hypothetical protein